ncbi:PLASMODESMATA CALLOSE-BINDING PROTEIN 5-like [Juglans microcarpa x Juglans regia]|uniref:PLASMODESMATA CALLOSE-BINDING PROTEIN 5-like n=1 Tax=Juglans microcarpa x Juglans regia TaxID=2249226 RepID=UPI001B7DF2AB|nr:PLASMODESMATA CALLOSE-BINDING PROTEIN 5-like [Juglans microcarpa x Juglans regia]
MAKTLRFSSLLLFLTLLDVPLSRASIPQRRTVSRAQKGVVGTELWCVAKNNAEDAALQASLDWACGPGAADSGPIQQGGSCYDPNDIQATASFAFNDYYLRHGLTDDSCFFDNNAALTSLNPSHDKCKFPSSLSVNNGSFSSPTTAVGMGPSEDMSGCTQIAQQWFWPLITCHMIIYTGCFTMVENYFALFSLKLSCQ